MDEIKDLSDLEKVCDKGIIDKIFMEYALLLRGKGEKLDKVVEKLNEKEVKIEDIKGIIESDDFDF